MGARTLPTVYFLNVLLLGLSGCALSDDPREGGLFGYWATGESGYQRRINERKTRLGSAQRTTASLQREHSSLSGKYQNLRAQVAAQSAEIQRLEQQLDALTRKTKDEQLRREATAQRTRLERLRKNDRILPDQMARELSSIRSEVQNLQRKAGRASSDD